MVILSIQLSLEFFGRIYQSAIHQDYIAKLNKDHVFTPPRLLNYVNTQIREIFCV